MAFQEPQATHLASTTPDCAVPLGHSAGLPRVRLRRRFGGLPSSWRTLLGVFVAVILLLAPVTMSGIWDPIELRVADMASRVAETLFHASLPDVARGQSNALPTLGELGRGELPYTSIAIGFRLFGLHDWAGRIPLALWIIAGLVAIVAWVHRYMNQRAAVWTALAFPTIPLIFFQARFMLGDATTIGTLTATFVALCFACISPSGSAPMAGAFRARWLAVGMAISVLGVISRGLLLAVGVPFVATGVAALLMAQRKSSEFRETRIERNLAISVLVIGILACVSWLCCAFGNVPQQGMALIIQGSNLQRNFHPFSFDSIVSQLGHSTFPWSGALIFAMATVLTNMQARPSKDSNPYASAAIILLIILTATAQTILGSFGVVLPFPASAALAAILGIWLDSISTRKANLRAISIGIVAILVILVADFENLPDKVLVATANADAHLPASFRKESLQWAQVCGAIIFGALIAVGFGFGEGSRHILRRAEIRSAILRSKKLWQGHAGFFILLVETALLTGAVLLLATRMGLPFRRLRELSSPQRELLAWSWLAVPVLVIAFVCGKAILGAIDLFFSRGLGIPDIAKSGGKLGGAGTQLLSRFPGLQSITLERGAVCAVSIWLAASTFSLGWAARLGEHLSPRRALARYERLAGRGESLGLLGVRPQITQYYSKQRPEVLLDPDEAADWLLYEKVKTRWMIAKGDQLPRLNAAYRERCRCLQNIPVIDGRSSDILLISNHRILGVPSENPLDDILLDSVPQPQQKLSADFGGQVEVLGWELVKENGVAISELTVGRRYELRLFYRVLGRPTMDWETFVHIDGFGRRYNGDHETTQGRYPMSSWRTGDLLVDKQILQLDPSFSHGNYELYFGFFKGSRRLEVRRGRQDEDRLIAGTIRVR